MPTTCPAVEIGDAAVIVCVAFSFESRDANFAKPKSSTFTRPIVRHHHVRGLEIAMHHTALVRSHQRIG